MNVTKRYGASHVLRDVSVSVIPGEMTAIIGPSGAGKSTILRILACLEAPESGLISIDDDEFPYPLTEAVQAPAPWPKVTAVFQQLFLWPHMTLRQNIALPLRLRNVCDLQAIVARLIERFDMGGFIDRYPNQVSGGQRQRAAIARALALQPSYLLLDEITSALDIEQAASIIEHLDSLKREGIGILMITHYLGFLRGSADRIVFMEDGEVIETGGCETLADPKSERFKRFVECSSRMEGICRTTSKQFEKPTNSL